jgi:hypothetical protein
VPGLRQRLSWLVGFAAMEGQDGNCGRPMRDFRCHVEMASSARCVAERWQADRERQLQDQQESSVGGIAHRPLQAGDGYREAVPEIS